MLKAAPTRIVALSPDVADVVMALSGSQRLAAVPELTKRPEHSVNASTAAQVPTFLGTDAGKEPEKILALNPDLVMLTTRHGAEIDGLKQLDAAGVPVLTVASDWDTPERCAAKTKAISQALGEEAKADKLVVDYQARWAKAAEAGARRGTKPTVAMIRILGPNTWLNGPGTIGHTVLGAAGATSASDIVGLKESGKLDIEQLVKVDPDTIVVVDSSVKGLEQYRALLDNHALASLKAIQSKRVVVITSANLSSGTGASARWRRSPPPRTRVRPGAGSAQGTLGLKSGQEGLAALRTPTVGQSFFTVGGVARCCPAFWGNLGLRGHHASDDCMSQRWDCPSGDRPSPRPGV